MCILYRQTGISSSPPSLKCLRLLSLLISIRGKAGLITGNTVLLITSMCIASKCSGGRFSSHLHWCKSRVIELCHIESRRTALIGFSVSIKILLNSASDSVLSLFSFGSALISRVQLWFRTEPRACAKRRPLKKETLLSPSSGTNCLQNGLASVAPKPDFFQ